MTPSIRFARLACRLASLGLALSFVGCGDPNSRQIPMGDDAAVAPPKDLSAAADAARDLSITGDLQSPCGPCAQPTPICDPKAKKCVTCLTDDDCPTGNICKMAACMPGCSAMHSACGDAGSCDVDLGACHGCLADKDCKDQQNPFCDLSSGLCGTCNTTVDKCPGGSYCGPRNGTLACLPGCKASAECQAADGGNGTTACCNHVCLDTATSLGNCGACGQACNKSACCAGQCFDTKADVLNCGGCGVKCKSQNTIPTCGNGVCGSAGCAMGFTDCDNNMANGCEANTSIDVNNCGACGNRCNVPNASPLCLNGKCVIASCNSGYRDCNGDPSDGCETNVQSDFMNCGTCGNNCASLPHASAGCMNAGCVVGTCANGYANCDKVDANGCESQLSADPMNCGACGKVCPAPPNVFTTCTNSLCASNGCNPGFADCDNNMANGCEVNLNTSTANCGGCAKVCPTLANSQPSCVMGACGLGACNNGFADCDKNPANGCEQNVASDPKNCGGCAIACNGMQMCANGKCVSNGVFVGMLGNQSFYKIQVTGAMTDTNVFAACKAAGMTVGCQAMGNCNYNDNMCTMTQEASCGNPMQTLAQKVCGGQSPPSCPALYGAFQYMGHTWVQDSACGAEAGQWCVTGNTVQNRFALCVQ